MNYYHDLLASYSKLKQRSFKLNIQEADAAKKKSAKPKKSEPEKKNPSADREEKKGAQMEAAFQKAVQAYNTIKSNPQQYTQAAEVPGASKPTTALVTLHPQTGVIQSLKFNNSSPGGKEWWVSLISRGQEKPQKYEHKGSAWYEFTKRFSDKDEMSDEEDAESTGQEKEGQEAEEQLIQATQEQNEAMLHQIQVDFGVKSSTDTDKPILSPELDYFGEGEDNERNGFIANVKKVLSDWVEDIETPIEVKVEGANRLRSFVELSVTLKDKGDKPFDGAEIDSLTALMNNFSITDPVTIDKKGVKTSAGPGEMLLTNLTDSDATALKFGLTVTGERAKGFDAMLQTLNDAKDKYNSIIGEEDSPIADATIEEVIESGNAGRTVNDRAGADEALMAGAGLVESIVAAGTETRSWGIQKLKDLAEEAYKKLIPQQLAETLGKGLAAINGEGVPSLLLGAQTSLTDALLNRLQVSFPKNFPDQEAAEDFVGELAADPEGIKAFATFLLLRGHSFRQVMGEHAPLISVAKGSKWSSVFRRKMDVAYIFPQTDTQSIEKHLNGYLEKHGVGENAEKFIVPTTLQDLKDNGVLEDADIPPHLLDKLDTEVTVAAVSLKTLSDYTKSANLGSNAGNSVISREGVKSFNGEERGKIFDSIIKSAGVTKTSIESLKQFYRSISSDGTPKIVQQALMEGANKHARTLKRTKTPHQLDQFKRSLALDILTVGGIASEPQLNVTNYLHDGNSTVESDEAFRNKLYKSIKSGKWNVVFGGKDATTDNFSNKNLQIFIKDKKGNPIVRVNSSTSSGRFNIWKTAEYQQSLMPEKPVKENTMLRQFLSAQSELIQELLAH